MDNEKSQEVLDEQDALEGIDALEGVSVESFEDGIRDSDDELSQEVIDELDQDALEEESDSDKDDDNPSDESDDDKEEKPGSEEGTDDEKPTEDSDDSSKEENSESEEQQQQLSENITQEFIGEIANETGLDGIKTKDDLVNLLKNPSKLLDAEIAAALEFRNAGGDIASYFEIKGRDYEKIDGKEVLLQKYLKDHPNEAAHNRSHAEKKFLRSYNKQYELLNKSASDFESEEEHNEWLSKNQDDIDFLKEDRENEIALARKEMKLWQDERTTIKTESGLTDEQAADLAEKHKESVTKALSSFKGLNISVNDKSDDDFTVGIDDDISKEVEKLLITPGEFLNSIGINPETGMVDTEKLRDAIFKNLSFGKVGRSLKKYVLEKFNEETIEGRHDSPADREQSASGSKIKKDLLGQLGDQVEAKRDY